ncbi:hypothetical protein Nepgr_018887 [Nepenthes gracilis]|uniref:FAE domain-containing protein n=1 Tax=Nepenthes gracilis TaxID=150966 RepID=A0AAD3SW02_NEPGR|nr:hypothetical protein Nepgr_018887 [Nepenthes gracilis]
MCESIILPSRKHAPPRLTLRRPPDSHPRIRILPPHSPSLRRLPLPRLYLLPPLHKTSPCAPTQLLLLQAPPHRKCTYELSEYFIRKNGRFTHTTEHFMRSIYLKSGLGNETYAPPFFFDPNDHPKPMLGTVFQEAREGMFSAVDSSSRKPKFNPFKLI